MFRFNDWANQIDEATKAGCNCWSGYKRVPGTKPCAPGSCVKESVELDESLDPSEIAGNPKMYDASTVKKAYYHKSVSASDKQSLARHLDRHHGNKEWRKPVKEDFEYTFNMLEEAVKAIDSGEYDYEGQMARTQLQTILRNSKDLIDMLSDEENMPEWVQSKITLAQDYISSVRDYLQSREELDEQFDLIEEYVEEISMKLDVHTDVIWEKFDSVDDKELYEAAVDAKGHKSSTGGLTQKGRDAYNAKGANLQAPVTTPPSKLKAGSKAANRRKSFCARMGGMEGAMKKPNGEPTRKALALRKWNC